MCHRNVHMNEKYVRLYWRAIIKQLTRRLPFCRTRGSVHTRKRIIECQCDKFIIPDQTNIVLQSIFTVFPCYHSSIIVSSIDACVQITLHRTSNQLWTNNDGNKMMMMMKAWWRGGGINNNDSSRCAERLEYFPLVQSAKESMCTFTLGMS